MKNRKFMAVLAMVLVCILSAAGCKKNVGSPEDNPVQEEEEEEQQSGQTVTTEGDAVKEDAYYLMEVNGYVVVFLSDKKTAYDYTSIEVSSLPATVQNEVKNGKYIESTELLYSFLENYTS